MLKSSELVSRRGCGQQLCMQDFRFIIGRVHAFNSKFLGSDGLGSTDRRDQRKIVHHYAILDEANRNHRQRAKHLWRLPIRPNVWIGGAPDVADTPLPVFLSIAKTTAYLSPVLSGEGALNVRSLGVEWRLSGLATVCNGRLRAL
jgi:hypothetical protein